MAEPSNVVTMTTLMKLVAEKLGVGGYRSTGQLYIPTDQYQFELCRQYVTNGIEMFMADSPPKGWRWMRRLCSVSVVATYTGTATGGTSATLVDSSRTEADDFFNGYDIYIESGTGIGESATITNFVSSTGTFEFTALSGGSTPDTTSAYTIATSTDAINGDGSRYKLPANFGGTVDGKIEYIKGSSHGASIEWRDEAFLRRRRTVIVTTGYPNYAAIRPHQPTSESLSATRQWEIIFDPRPAAADTLEFPYTLYFDGMDMESGIATEAGAAYIADNTRSEANDYFDGWILTVVDGTGAGETATITNYLGASGEFHFTALSNGTTPDTTSKYVVEPAANLHPAGHQFDDVIKAACLARTEMESQDEHSDTLWTDYYHKKALPNAHRVDSRSAPRNLGPMSNGPRWYRRRRGTWSDVTTEHDIAST